MKKNKKFPVGAAVLCILLPMFFGCNDYTGDFVDPFVGVWKEDKGANTRYWEFRIDGTGGWASTKDGPFGNDFSFFVYDGDAFDQPPPPDKSLVIVEDYAIDDGVTRYVFEIKGKKAVLTQTPTPTKMGSKVKLKRVKEGPAVLELNNRLIGSWDADWNGDHLAEWSIMYRKDATVKLFHRQMGHQFDCGYAVRGDILVIFGYMRFGSFNEEPIISVFSAIGGNWNNLEVVELGGSPQWEYVKDPHVPWQD